MSDHLLDHEPLHITPHTAELNEQNDLLYHQILAAGESVAKIRDPEMRHTLEVGQEAQESVAEAMHLFDGLSTEEQVEKVEEIVDIVFDEDPEAVENLKLINAAREQGSEEEVADLIARQKGRYTEIRRQVAFTLGVEIDDTAKEDEDYREKLMERVAGMGDAPDEEIMKQLGFLIPDEETGVYKFAMPKDVFPPHIVDKWERYVASVAAHSEAAAKFRRGIEDNAGDITSLDAIRRYAHNNLASTVKEFLQLTDERWDLERSREFITKMVKQKFPTIETSESKLTSEAVVNRLRTIEALNQVVSVHPTPEN